MAERTLIVRVIGDDRSLQTAMKRDQVAVTQFGAASTSSLKKVDTAFSRTQRIAAGGFLGGAAFLVGVGALKSIVKAAQDSEESLGQTRVALESTGKSWADYGKQIEDAIAVQSKLGFDDEALLRTFSLFVRKTGDVGQALRENNIAMDVSRARFLDLEQAANIVNKAALGQAGALRRIGIDAKNGASGVELLAQLEREFGGSAEDASNRSTAAFDRLNVSVENIQETLGQAATPALADFANVGSDAADDIDVLIGGLGRLGDVKIPAIHIPFAFDVPGGGSTAGHVAGQIGKFLVKETVATTLPGVFIAHEVIQRFNHDVADATRKETPQVARSIGVTFSDFIDNVLINASAQVKPTVSFGDLLKNVLAGTADPTKLSDAISKAIGLAKNKLGKAISSQKQGLDDQKLQKSFAHLIEGLQLKVDQAGLTRGLDDDLGALEALKAGLEKQIKAGVDVGSAQSQLVTVVQAIADKQDEIRAKAAEAVQARQFRALGLGGTGEDLIPGVENLRKQLGSLTRRLAKSGADLPSKLAQQLAGARKVLSGELGKATGESRDKINQLFKTIRDTFDQESKRAIPQDRHVQLSDKILKALGFDQNIDAAKLTKLRPAPFRAPTFATAAAGAAATGTAGVTITGPVTVVADNPDAFLRELQKKAGRTSGMARGRFPGRSLGLG